MDLMGAACRPAKADGSRLRDHVGIDPHLAAATALRQQPLSALIISQISEGFMDIPSLQRPLKDLYRQDPAK